MGRNVSSSITPAQSKALVRLAGHLSPETYLAGGVGVALYLGHRVSRDLDLFVPSEDPAERVEAFAQDPAIEMTSRAVGTVYLRVEGVPVSVIRYRYPLLGAPTSLHDLPVAVASIDDLICMKLSAIGNRGALRDFWDLHAMMTVSKCSLDRALELYQEKYANEDTGHVIRSLVYFADAEAEPMPAALTSARWQDIKQNLRAWVRALEQ